MPQPAQRFLEYVFLAVLYLFFLRVVRAVWVELREPRLVASAPEPSVTQPARQKSAAHKRGALRLAVVAPEKGGVYDLQGDEMTIGRSPGCAIALPEDSFISQVHARVFRRDNEYWVEDLGSTNGTLFNGRKMTTASPLRKGDRLQMGRTIVEVAK